MSFCLFENIFCFYSVQVWLRFARKKHFSYMSCTGNSSSTLFVSEIATKWIKQLWLHNIYISYIFTFYCVSIKLSQHLGKKWHIMVLFLYIVGTVAPYFPKCNWFWTFCENVFFLLQSLRVWKRAFVMRHSGLFSITLCFNFHFGVDLSYKDCFVWGWSGSFAKNRLWFGWFWRI